MSDTRHPITVTRHTGGSFTVRDQGGLWATGLSRGQALVELKRSTGLPGVTLAACLDDLDPACGVAELTFHCRTNVRTGDRLNWTTRRNNP